MSFRIDEAVAVLERTPGTLRALLSGLPETWILAAEGPSTWRPIDVLGHLVHGEDTDWIPRVRMILEYGESRTFEVFDRFAHERLLAGRSIEDLLIELATKRAANLSELRSMPALERDLERRGRHPAFGPVTLRQLLSTWVVHDLGHVAQITRVMAKRYAREIGPWQEYLPIVSR